MGSHSGLGEKERNKHKGETKRDETRRDVISSDAGVLLYLPYFRFVF